MWHRYIAKRLIRRCSADAHRGGNEFCGNPERHEYELYLAIEDIDHSRTKTKSPQTNGKCALRSRGAKGLRHPHCAYHRLSFHEIPIR